VVCEPANAALISSDIPQKKDAQGNPASHPGFNPHPMQGWTPDFISKLTNDSVSTHMIDQLLTVTGEDALRCSRALAKEEGIFVGISAGGTFAAALEVASQAPKGSNILCMLPDTGERYLSTPLFANVEAEMSEEELALSDSTPGCRFEAAPA
jgi:cysteine synthase A